MGFVWIIINKEVVRPHQIREEEDIVGEGRINMGEEYVFPIKENEENEEECGVKLCQGHKIQISAAICSPNFTSLLLGVWIKLGG